MAYMNQERKAKIAPEIKVILKKYGVKGSLAVRNHSTLVLNIKSGKIDFIKNFEDIRSKRPEYLGDKMMRSTCLSVNPYWYHDHFSGNAKSFLKEVFTVMNMGNHDNSDIMTDYFDVGWYVDVNVGLWNKPYILE